MPQSNKAWAVLNCTLGEANATFAVCNTAVACTSLFPKSGRRGPINETANACSLEDGMRSKPCYEWMGGDANLDVLNEERQKWRTLDFDLFHASGYGAN
jgi:hypothetical protein